MKISKERLEEFKDIAKKNGREFKSDEEAEASAQHLVQLAELLFDQAMLDIRRKNRLKKEPKGFPLEVGKFYTCTICRRGYEGCDGWFDKNGQKCKDCQRNIDNKIIPQYVCKYENKDKWVEDWEIKSKYGIHPATKNKLIRDKKIKPRELTLEDGSVYCRVFILKENPHLLTD